MSFIDLFDYFGFKFVFYFVSFFAVNSVFLWKVIEEERVDDYSHRAPKKRAPSTKTNTHSE